MKFYSLWFAFIIPFDPFVEINHLPICKNCNNIHIESNSCKLFGNINLVTGEKTYMICSLARQNSTLCGTDARFYIRYIPFSSF